MKKIFRMALVFALAGATLMYTGCSKDYSEDINSLDQKVSALGSELGTKYQDLLNQLSSAKTSLEAAYKAADKELSDGFNTKINAIQNDINGINAALAKKADKADVDAAISQLQKDVEAELAELRSELEDAAEELEKTAEALREEVQKNLKDFYGIMSDELKSLVFVPDFYYAGIEATDYTYAYVGPQKFNKEPKDRVITVEELDKPGHFEWTWRRIGPHAYIHVREWVDATYKNVDTKFTLLKNEPTSVDYKKNKDGQQIFYTHGQIAEALYNLNPSTFDTEKAEWSLEKDDYLYVSKADEKKVWAPEVVGTPANEDGVAVVKYIINNPEIVASPYFAQLAERFEDNLFIDALAASQVELEDYVPVMKLNATIKGDKPKNISSDYEAIVVSPEFFTELAFVKDSYKTGFACGLGGDDLFIDAETAVLAAPSIPVAYNKGAFDLAPYIAIHMERGMGGYETTLDKLQAAYPELSMTYQLINYTIGDNKTPQSAYGRIEGSKFFPQYVNAEGKSVDCTATSGESAVGKYPVVLVTLYDGEEVVLAGYFKIEIVKEVSNKTITLPEFGPFPYICADKEVKTTWSQFSALILEELGTNYGEFVNDYEIEKKDGAVVIYTMRDGKLTSDMKIYDKDGKDTGKTLNYGTIEYNQDADGTGINDAFVWTITNEAAKCIGAGKEQTIYVKFTKGQYNTLYIGFTAAIADAAQITYGEINTTYWFNDVEADVQNTVRANVLVPNATTDNVLNFVKDLDDFFVGNKVKVTLKDESKEVYSEAWKTITTVYTYKFAASQPVINGVPFVANADGTVLYVAAYDTDKKEYKKDDKGNYIASDKAIASFDANGNLTYQTNDTAKEFLNLWGISETEVEKMLYANVQIDYKAGDGQKCAIAEGSDVFHVRFVRPLTITNGEGGSLVDGMPTGSEVALGNLFNAIDWNGLNEEPLFKWHAKTEKENWEGFVANTFKGIVWFSYYGISKIKVDCDKTLSNQNGDWAPLFGENGVNPNAKLQLNNGSAKDDDNIAEVEYRDNINKLIDDLSSYKLHYENNMGVAKDFAFRIPVEVTYKWGTIKVDVEVPVKGTQTK